MDDKHPKLALKDIKHRQNSPALLGGDGAAAATWDTQTNHDAQELSRRNSGGREKRRNNSLPHFCRVAALKKQKKKRIADKSDSKTRSPAPTHPKREKTQDARAVSSERAKGAEKASCGETVVKRVFLESPFLLYPLKICP